MLNDSIEIFNDYEYEIKFYEWTSDFSKARRDIEDCYNAVLCLYRIKKDRVVLGGFYGGAMASLNLLMHNAFPIKGVSHQFPDNWDSVVDDAIKFINNQ